MKIFVSYCHSARPAEGELFDFFDGLQCRYERSRASFVSRGSDGLFCVLLGLVCDLQPDEDSAQSKVFVGLAGGQSLVSFPMDYSEQLENPKVPLVFSAGDEYSYRNPLFNELSAFALADPNYSLRAGVSDPAPDTVFRYAKGSAWGASDGSQVADVAEEHLKSPIFQRWDYGSPRAEWNSSDPRMSDLLTLLAHALKDAGSPTVIQELLTSYRCKLARASIHFEAGDWQPLRRSGPDIPKRILQILAGLHGHRELATWSGPFWNNRNISTRSFGMFAPQYSLLLERRSPFPWSWLQLLALAADAGRRTGARLRTYSIPAVLKLRWRRGNRPARGSGRGAGPPSELTPTQTVADLFRGGEGALLHSYELQQWTTMRLAGRKRLLQIERSLIVPDRDTVYSLFRGSPVRAPTRKPSGNA